MTDVPWSVMAMFMGAASALAPLRLTHTNKSPAHHGKPFAPREGLRTVQQQPTNTRTATEFTDPRTSVRLKRMKFLLTPQPFASGTTRGEIVGAPQMRNI
jgi:hypothetical protein